MLQRLPRMETPAPRTEKETKEMKQDHPIASTNPLAELPSDKIKTLEAGLEALRTLRLSGVDWQRLAAEE